MENKIARSHKQLLSTTCILLIILVMGCASKPAEDNYEYGSVGGLQGYATPKKKVQSVGGSSVCETQDKNCQDKKISDQMNICRTKRDAESCYATGRLMEEYFDKWVKGWRGTSQGDKTHKVLKWYSLGCDRGNDEACIALKEVLISTCKVSGNTSRDGESCAEVGHYEAKRSNYALAEKIYKASCTRDDKSGCGGLLCIGYVKMNSGKAKEARAVFDYVCKAAPSGDGLSDAVAERGCFVMPKLSNNKASSSQLAQAKENIVSEDKSCKENWKNQWGSPEEE